MLGIGYDPLTMSEALSRADALLRAGTGGSIVTANSEILLRARRNGAYAAAVNGADLVLADGVGVVYASRILGTPLPGRVAGADLVPLLLDELARRRGSVFLYGGRPGVAARAGERLSAAYPGLRISGTENGYISRETALLARLESARPDLLLLALGAPRQELWMRAHRSLGCVMIGVGGLLDLYAGDVKRAPESWQRAGLEWLYRLGRQPRRIVRVAPLPEVLLLAAAERIKKGVRRDPENG